eukprot:891877-Pleurochrysis_carterae.AAC.6
MATLIGFNGAGAINLPTPTNTKIKNPRSRQFRPPYLFGINGFLRSLHEVDVLSRPIDCNDGGVSACPGCGSYNRVVLVV